MLGDVIAAVSTPMGRGGVAVLRISGEGALEVCERVFAPKNGKRLSELPPRYAAYGEISMREENGERSVIDDGIATVFRAPASFTGEDTVEICCHGGILLTQTVLSALLCEGARPAEAGEFTKRAFLNGKLGLSAAEALANLLEAQTREQILLAHSTVGGRTRRACESIYADLRRTLASVYACIDYPEEDLAEMSREEIVEALSESEKKIHELSESYRTGHAVAEGIKTVICGKPNVGKSSLYNRILGREAAIVTDVQGTTRDVLTETAALGKVTLRLSDTAGLRSTEDRVEQIGIARAKDALSNAELVLALFDASIEPDGEDLELCEELCGATAPVIALLNKCDRGEGAYADFYRERFASTLSVSAQTGAGMEELQALVESLFIDGKLDLRSDPVLSNARQQASAINARDSLREALQALEAGYPVDVCCTSVENAMAELGELDGRAVSEDLVSEIFSHFCVGK